MRPPIEEVAGVMAEPGPKGGVLAAGGCLEQADRTAIRRAHAVCPVTAIQNRYSMMARWHESLFPMLEELNIGLVAFSPLANGFLSGAYGKDSRFDPKLDYRSNMPQFTAGAIDQNRALLALLNRFTLGKERHPGAGCALTGCCAKSRT